MPEFLMLTQTPLWEAALRLVLAALLAFSVGFERYVKDKPLDVRPFMMVSVGACLAVIATMELAATVNTELPVSVDPAKVFNGIITGIGFLGAGAMFRADGAVNGAATAASVWVMGAVGICCGMGLYGLALLGALSALGVLLLLGPLAAQTKDGMDEVEDSVARQRNNHHDEEP
ncbi:MgtC/SapB family protein [Euryhalocaulis caribicus]|uniref:MgtC/SapB family protein n=1 Tax=Euryhalocaulis caribicus TaxID=1161401 RepID=UPI0003A9FA83|nr:MgtC/SapB family protein [Euryhalocaulis caribicus]